MDSPPPDGFSSSEQPQLEADLVHQRALDVAALLALQAHDVALSSAARLTAVHERAASSLWPQSRVVQASSGHPHQVSSETGMFFVRGMIPPSVS